MKTILVADDEKWSVEKLIKELEERYIVEYVPDGKQAIERIKQGGLDGAVLDWEMLPRGVDAPGRFYGDIVAIEARSTQPDLALVLRSTSATAFAEQLKPYDVYCHDKYHRDGNRPILEYFQEKLGE